MTRVTNTLAALTLAVVGWLAVAGPAQAWYYPRVYPYYPAYPYYPVLIGPQYLQRPTPTATDPAAGLPSVSGPLSSPPPGTALIEVRVPQTWAAVSFNGNDSFTSGRQRTFVTPTLSSTGGSWTVSASWTQNGQPHQAEQTVRAQPGQVRVVTFR